ncbi:MAG: type 1 glutamine amidotransferase, partial [Candidatus Thermoplasmatota archaeon]|nr:type 1 glutamine amidotransferase [Candidatus Thermoplasmatota archaeon]
MAERIEFGHGGNIEMIKPFTDFNSEIEVFLVTPQYEIYTQFERLELKKIKKENVPNWDDDVEFKSEFSDLIDGTLVKFFRILTPVGKVEDLSKWVDKNNFSCVFCSGSRRNVSQPEQWMINAKNLLMGTILAKKPLLGICFGHQLLAETLGGTVTRSSKRTDAVYNLNLTNLGSKDPLFDGLSNNGEGPITLYTHQDHVVNISTDQKIIVELLGSSKHCKNAAIRARIDDELLPVWGVQFHPEASKARINRSYDLGHITLEEKESF